MKIGRKNKVIELLKIHIYMAEKKRSSLQNFKNPLKINISIRFQECK